MTVICPHHTSTHYCCHNLHVRMDTCTRRCLSAGGGYSSISVLFYKLFYSYRHRACTTTAAEARILKNAAQCRVMNHIITVTPQTHRHTDTRANSSALLRLIDDTYSGGCTGGPSGRHTCCTIQILSMEIAEPSGTQRSSNTCLSGTHSFRYCLLYMVFRTRYVVHGTIFLPSYSVTCKLVRDGVVL